MASGPTTTWGDRTAGGWLDSGSGGGWGGRLASTGLRLGCLADLEGSVLRCAPSMVSRGGWVCTGMYFLRNLRLHRVILPDPSTRTMYWSNCRTSITTPVLSHLLGYGPVSFWIRTWLPTAKGGSLLVCSVHRSAAFVWRFPRASSRWARVSFQVG